MSDQHKQPAPLFGVSLTPVAHEAEKLLHLSQVADSAGLDLLAIQDHPYNPTFLDTWTLLALIGGQTRQIRLTADRRYNRADNKRRSCDANPTD